jgi:competence protein ComEA
MRETTSEPDSPPPAHAHAAPGVDTAPPRYNQVRFWTSSEAKTLAFALLILASVASVFYVTSAGWRRVEFGKLDVSASAQSIARPGFSIDLNSAPWTEFAQLPGIGETLARRIVERRDSVGPYLSIESVVQVRGIGEKKLNAIRDYLSIGSQANETSAAVSRD